MKQIRQTGYYLCLGGLLLAATGIASADEWNKKTYITTSQPIEVPGAVLPPGKYVFKLLDSASDRHIVQILNERENHVFSTNLAIPAQRMEPADKTILTFYEVPGGGPEPVRMWFYPGDTIGQEFRYPKDRARMIAQATGLNVPVIAQSRDKSSETTVESGAAQQTAPVNNDTTATASATAPAAPAPAPAEVEPTPSPAPSNEATEMEPSPAPAPPPVQEPAPAPAPEMPKTAGNLFELGLAGMTCLGAAVALRRAERRSTNRS